MSICFLGDQHGNISNFLRVIDKIEKEHNPQVYFQLGDFGFMGEGFLKFLKNVNKKIIYDLGLKKLGGIDITEKTPLSVVLRGIHYSYCDMYKLVHNQYPTNDGIVPGWYCNLYRRCEYAECEGQWYY